MYVIFLYMILDTLSREELLSEWPLCSVYLLSDIIFIYSESDSLSHADYSGKMSTVNVFLCCLVVIVGGSLGDGDCPIGYSACSDTIWCCPSGYICTGTATCISVGDEDNLQPDMTSNVDDYMMLILYLKLCRIAQDLSLLHLNKMYCHYSLRIFCCTRRYFCTEDQLGHIKNIY
ncbi:uncharacterized protein LOC130050128 isoform X1 [Ostrea edulis]|uniref:uncharacterized protein LOC130050128 isoform X1 n=1 Tax=Ostrea edulis TaxID=37623 RepID=UPI0024AF51E4|nr:uncharacterized protein LOC130050128 isoform X1 [Ostrea edulis]